MTASGEPRERVGEGLREVDIVDWTCFSCGARLTQAHAGDYFHTDPDSGCTEAIPVPTSLLEDDAQTSAREA